MGRGGRGRRGQVWIWAEITSVRKTFLVHEEHRCREINMKELGRVRLGKLGKLRQWARKPECGFRASCVCPGSHLEHKSPVTSLGLSSTMRIP